MNRKQAQSDSESPKYWFPAKKYGWGWGLPSAWQGWLVLGLFILTSASSTLMADGSPGIAVAIVLLAAVVLIAICFWKGEPPQWRWGDAGESD